MRLVLDPAEEAVHGEWLRQTPGAYEWWYFDALSEDGNWALTCIWFLGNPFSPYYRHSVQGLSAQGVSASPFAHNALFIALYYQGQLHAYHFTRFPETDLQFRETMPLCLQFGPNRLVMSADGVWTLILADTNANGRHLDAVLTFTAPPLIAGNAAVSALDADHSWLPIAPACRVTGQITLTEPHNPGSEQITFAGSGYHDHNWGKLPFDAAIRDWYWARAELSGERAIILYHVRPHHDRPISHLLLFERGRLMTYEPEAGVHLSRSKINAFGTRYATELRASAGGLNVTFRFGARLDSSPFYLRTLCSAIVEQGYTREMGQGIGEYLRPRLLSSPIAASAMKARIVEF